MLNMALVEKGVISSSGHNEVTRPPAVVAVDEQENTASTRRVVEDGLVDAPDEDGGIVL